MLRMAWGHFTRPQLRRYLMTMAGVFWGLILLAWLSYPREHHYSIMSHTFSFLGSNSEEHNPGWWWIFSIAMMFWSVSMLPIVQYTYRRFAVVSKWAAGVGAFLFVLGSVGIAIVALFPDSKDVVLGFSSTEVHEKGAVLVAIGYTLGILWHAGMFLRDRLTHRHGGFRLRKLAWPYAAWSGMVGMAAYNQITWGLRYETMKAEAARTGTSIRSSWGESLNTIYAFPLWENLVIYTLFLFLVWFALAVPHEPGARVDQD